MSSAPGRHVRDLYEFKSKFRKDKTAFTERSSDLLTAS